MATIPDPSSPVRVAIIGGGAAGFFTAVNAAEKNGNLVVTIFEAGQKPLQKVAISGGGRCNVTHGCFDPLALTEFYPRGNRELKAVFARFQPRDTIQWFADRGLKLHQEADGRLFPVSNDSQDVIRCLRESAHKLGVKLLTGTRVDSVTRIVTGDASLFTVTVSTRNGTALVQTQHEFDVVMLSTGYSPTGWAMAQSLGHKVIKPVPSLFPLTIRSEFLNDLQGISLQDAIGRLIVSPPGREGEKPTRVEARGAMLITHTGLSGPLIYRLSAWGARALAEDNYRASLQLDLCPDRSEEEIRARLTVIFTQEANLKKLANTTFEPLSHRLWLAVLTHSGLDPEQRADSVSKKGINKLVETLKRLTLEVIGKSPSKEEFVSCGGVTLKEVDFRTLESRKVPGLYFGGEILDIDALTGGFNFQACWSAGWVVSEALK